MLYNKAVQEAKENHTEVRGFGEWVGGAAEYTFSNEKTVNGKATWMIISM